MRLAILIPAALVLLTLQPSWAGDYAALKEERAAYQPPDIFSVPDVEVPTAEKDNSEIRSGVSALKPAAMKALPHLGHDLLDADSLARISPLATDVPALTRYLKGKMDLEDLRAIALLRNPGIGAAREKVLSQVQSFDQVMNLDDLLRRYTALTRDLDPKAGPINAKDAIKMAFPGPGLTALKGQVVQNDVNRAMSLAEVTGKTVLKDVTDVFWDLFFITRSMAVTRETAAALTRLRGVATILYRSGKTSHQDIIKINIKLAELEESLVTLASRKETAETRLFELMDLERFETAPLDTDITIAHLPTPSALTARALARRQELSALRFRIAKVEAMVALAETMTQSRQTLGLSAFDTGLFSVTGTDAPKTAFPEKTMAAMKNNAPVRPLYGITSPWLNQTRKTLEGLKNTLKNQENATNRMVRQAWFKADKSARELALYRDRILPLAQSALDVASREYESGTITFSQAIGSYTDWLAVRLSIAEKRSLLGQALAELETVTGYPIR